MTTIEPIEQDERHLQMSDWSAVYVASTLLVSNCRGGTKIGYSNDPMRRVTEHRRDNTAAPFGKRKVLDLYSSVFVPGAKSLERLAHQHFANYEIENEWFAIKPETASTFLVECASILWRGGWPELDLHMEHEYGYEAA